MIKYLALILTAITLQAATPLPAPGQDTNGVLHSPRPLLITNANTLFATNLNGFVSASGLTFSNRLSTILGYTVYPWQFGIVGDGTDESVLWQNLANYVNTNAGGATIVVPRSIDRYVCAGVLFTQQNLSMIGVGMPIFATVTNSIFDIFRFKRPLIGKISGIWFDGRQQEITDTNYWKPTITVAYDNLVIEGCVFTNYFRAGIFGEFFSTNSMLTIQNNLFRNGRNLEPQLTASNLANLSTTALAIGNSGSTNNKAYVIVRNNIFKQDTIAGPTYRYPSAVITSGQNDGTDAWMYGHYHNNYVENMNGLELYDGIGGASVLYNIVTNYVAYGIFSQMASDVDIGWNYVWPSDHVFVTAGGDSGAAISVAPHVRAADVHRNIKVHNNRLYGKGNTGELYGISARGRNFTDGVINNVIIEENDIEYFKVGVRITYAGDNVSSRKNMIISTNTSGLGAVVIENAMGIVDVDDYISATNAHGIYMVSNNTNGSIRLTSPRMSIGSGYYALVAANMSNVWINGGIYRSDSANPILISSGVHSFHLSQDAQLSGVPIINAGTTNISGRIPIIASPEGTYYGIKGAKALNINATSGNNPEWIKTTASTLNTGWVNPGVNANWVATVTGTLNEVEASPSSGAGANVTVGLPNTVLINTALGIGSTPGAATKFYATTTDDATKQVRFDHLGSGTSAMGQIVMANVLGDNLSMTVYGTNHATFARQQHLQSSGEMKLDSGGSLAVTLSATNTGINGNLKVVGSITNDTLTVDRVVISSGGRVLTSSPITTNELFSLSGIGGNVQTLLNAKQPLSPELTSIDNDSPGVNKYYGTDGSGTKGFYSLTNNYQYTALALTNITADLATGIGYAYYIFPVDGTIRRVWGNLFDPSSSGDVTLDININGSTTMSVNKITIEASEYWSGDATTQPVITSSNFNAGQVITVDIDAAGTDAKGGQAVIEWYPR